MLEMKSMRESLNWASLIIGIKLIKDPKATATRERTEASFNSNPEKNINIGMATRAPPEPVKPRTVPIMIPIKKISMGRFYYRILIIQLIY